VLHAHMFGASVPGTPQDCQPNTTQRSANVMDKQRSSLSCIPTRASEGERGDSRAARAGAAAGLPLVPDDLRMVAAGSAASTVVISNSSRRAPFCLPAL